MYSDDYISLLASKYGYSFVGLSFYLLDTDFDGYFDQIQIALECTATTISDYASWDILSIDTDSIGAYTNKKVSNYLSSITPKVE